MASILNQCKAAIRIALYLMVAYLAIKLWQNPSGSASATVDLIGGVGRFFATLIDKTVEFAQGFVE